MIFGQKAGIRWVFGDKNTPLPSEAKRVNQVHSNKVVLVLDPAEDTSLEMADALVTKVPGMILSVKTADCLPLLLYDPAAKVIGAVHAGWRGAQLGIIERSLEVMKELGAKDITALLGPSIQKDSYEVGKEFRDFFPDKYLTAANTSLFFDLPSFAKDILIKAGIKDLWSSDLNTYQSNDFYSYRRSSKLGKPLPSQKRQFAFIELDP
jgi:YfiH family protein